MKYLMLALSIITLLSSCNSIKYGQHYYLIKEGGKVGYIKPSGKIKIEPQYDDCELRLFHSEKDCITFDFWKKDLAIVQKDGLYGAIDKNNNVIIPFEYSYLDESYCSTIDKCFIAQKNGKYGMIDGKHKEIVPFMFEKRWYLEPDQPFTNTLDGYSIIYNPISNKIQYRTKHKLSIASGGLIKIEINDKVGYVDQFGNVVIDTLYQQGESIGYRDIYPIKKNGAWGYIDTLENTVIDFKYEDAEGFSYYNYAIVRKEGKYGVIDKSDSIIIPFKYNVLSEVIGAESEKNLYRFSNGFSFKTGIVNIKNDTIFPPSYYNLSYSEGFIVCQNGNGYYGMVDIETKEIILPFSFVKIDYWDKDYLMTVVFFDDNNQSHFGYLNYKYKVVWSSNEPYLEQLLNDFKRKK